MHLVAIMSNLRLQDVLDILFLTFVAYHLYQWFRGTKAFKALVGLLVLGIIFTIARTWGLFLTTWVFQILWQVLVLLLIILFQSEIRQALERVNPLQALGLRKRRTPGKWVNELSDAVFQMARERIGALIIIEREDRVEELITGGQELEGTPNAELVLSIFQKHSPLHDGAIVIRDGRVTHVACYLPLSSDGGLPSEWGTRHRAALGLSERCDALVIVVSEERGEVSLVVESKVEHPAAAEELSRRVLETFRMLAPSKLTIREKIQSGILNQWRVKAGAFVLVMVFWLLLAGQQDFEVAFSVPLQLKNVPQKMEILDPHDPRIMLRVRGLRKDASTLSDKNVRAVLDLSAASFGRRTFTITANQILLPSEGVRIMSIEPHEIRFKFRVKPSPITRNKGIKAAPPGSAPGSPRDLLR